MKVPQLALDGCDSWNQDANSWFQLHAVWHGAVAIGILFLAQYKRSIGDADLIKFHIEWTLNMLAFFTFNWIPSIPLDIREGRSDIDDRTIEKKDISAAAVTPVVTLV